MLRIFVSLFCANSLILSQTFQVPAIDFNPQKYICFKADGKIVIDGKINETSWIKAEWTKDFVDIEGPLKPSPQFFTRVKMLWDESYFYIAAEMQEPDIWGTLKNHDDIIYNDNDFEVFIDPDGDTHGYAELEINALNTVWDLFIIQPYRDIEKAAVHNWEIKDLQTAVTVYGTLNTPGDKDSCWTVEIAFPWKVFEEITSVSVPPHNNEQWRVNFSRVEWDVIINNGIYLKKTHAATGKPYPGHNWVWSPQGLINIHYPEMWGFVQFSEKTAGTSGIIFSESGEEKAKWLLRKIYYAQKNFYMKNSSYSSEISGLDIQLYPVPGFYSPVIESTSNQFEASVRSKEGDTVIRINQNGLITNSRKNKNE